MWPAGLGRSDCREGCSMCAGRVGKPLRRSRSFKNASRPPESGGQRDRDAVEIAPEEVPKPHSDKVCFGNLPSRDPSGRAALLTQEGVAPFRKASLNLDSL